MKTLESNKEIAKFMGAAILTTKSGREIYRFYDADGVVSDANETSKMRYDNSWDWLMPVIDKIIEIDITPAPNWTGFRVEIVPRGYVEISGFPMTPKISTNVSIEGSLIAATYKAVIKFINWYNVNMQSKSATVEVS